MTTWKKVLRRWSEALAAAATVLKVRKSGIDDPLAIVPELELQCERSWLAKRDYENQLMQQCIIGMTQGKSACDWCEERNECPHREEHPNGCTGWWLRFLTEEEEKACEQRAEAGCAEEAAEADAGADADAADQCAHQEWYHAGGFDELI